MDQIAAEEEEDVEQAEDDGEPCGCAADEEIIDVDRRVKERKLLHLDRQDHHDQHFFIREERREAEEEREVEEGVIGVAGE